MKDNPLNSSLDMSIHMANLDSIFSREHIHKWITVSLMVVIIISGVVGNTVLILAVALCKKMQDTTNYFIVNLSVCDLLFVTVILPFNIYTYITEAWYLDEWLCVFVGYLGYALTGTTLMSISLIAWNRYQLIINPGKYKQYFRSTKLICMLTTSWILPTLLLLPPLFGIWGNFGYVTIMSTCNLYLDHSSQSFKLTLLIVRAIIPSVLVVYCYMVINYTTRKSHNKMQNKIRLSSTLQCHLHKKELQLTRTMSMLFMVFALSYFPCAIAGIIDWNSILSKTFHMYCQITVYVGSTLNPVIYGLLNTRFRQACLEVICCKKPNRKEIRTDYEETSPCQKVTLSNFT